MERIEKEWIENVLGSIDFVEWDRYFSFPEQGLLTVFGWIKREKDTYKDFVILEFTLKPNLKPFYVYFLGTSSVKYSKRIADILGSDHSKCIRVEDTFNIKNMIQMSHVNIARVGAIEKDD